MAKVQLSSENGQLVLQNDHIRLIFARQHGWQLISMSSTTGHEYIAQNVPAGPLWNIQFLVEYYRQVDTRRTFEKDVQQELLELSSTAVSAGGFASHQEDTSLTLMLTWPGVTIADESNAADVTVEITLAEDALYAEWRLSVTMHSPRVGIQRVDFPMTGPLSAGPKAELAVPNGWGQLIVNPSQSRGYRGHFPCGTCDLQAANLCEAGNGLYLAAHDPKGNDKELVFVPDAAQRTISYRLVTYPAEMGTVSLGQNYSLPYAAAIGVFKGNWLTGAKCYRKWLPNATWWPRAPLAQREDTPTWLKETVLWLQSGGPAEQAVPQAQAFAAFFDVPTATHWYSWHEIPFDDHYPEYFPAKKGFKEGVAAMRQAGIKVMPYINGRLWDPRNDSWREEKAAYACAKDSQGMKYVEVYASHVALAVMCPTTELWQTKIAGIVQQLIADYGVNAVYIDQISAAPAKLCYDTGHPHTPGGGDLWVRGYRELLTKTRAAAKSADPDAMLTTEDAAEPFADLLDAFLMCNSTRDQLIPFYPAVYSGYSLTFGRYIFRQDMSDPAAFATKVGQMFVFGAQLGWLGPDILEPAYRQQADYLKRLAKIRQIAVPYLALGELVGFPTVTPNPNNLSTKWNMMNPAHAFAIEPLVPIDLPEIMGSIWRAADGSLGVVITNMGSEEVTCNWSTGELELEEKHVQVTCFEEGSKIEVGQLPSQGLSIPAQLKPYSARLYTITAVPAQDGTASGHSNDS